MITIKSTAAQQSPRYIARHAKTCGIIWDTACGQRLQALCLRQRGKSVEDAVIQFARLPHSRSRELSHLDILEGINQDVQ